MLSVIVPVYNTGEYLSKCLDSLSNQTCRDLEIILVDDGSTDKSGEICDIYANHDSRFRAIHKLNGGSTSARKAGLKEAHGEFIGYVDGDDWIEADYYENMINAQKSSGADIVISNHFHDIGEDSRVVRGFFTSGIYLKEQLMPTLLYSGNFFEYGVQPHMWSKIYRREVLEKAQDAVDERIVVGEDAAVVYPAILKSEKVCITDICGYHYVQHESSITKTKLNNELQMHQLLFQHLENVFRENDVWEVMRNQLIQYQKYLLFLRNMSVFDEGKEKVLLPYGGIEKGSKAVIYGAGGLGQKMYRYLEDSASVEIVSWADRSYQNYKKCGWNVVAPEGILEIEDYDCILIANTTQSAAESIKSALVEMGIMREKIKWFSEEFISAEI